jgi:hypothetical protein
VHRRGLSRRYTRWLAGVTLAALVLSISALWFFEIAGAEHLGNEALVGVPSFSAVQTDDEMFPPPDLACRLCHDGTEAQIEFPSGESLPVLVDLEAISNSAHGTHAGSPLLCTECHSKADYLFPHEPVSDLDLRSFEVSRSITCEKCHQQPHLTSHPGPESDNPVVCTDCHKSHEVSSVEQWQRGEGTDACVDCHEISGVPFTDHIQLTQIVRNGMFADRVDSEYCLACHSQEGLSLTFENGDVLPVTIDPDVLHGSVHGADNSWQALDCTDCHDRYTYPHDRPPVESVREYNLQRYTICAKCHENHYERTLDSVHGAAIDEGNLDAAVCTDCHGAHDTPPPDEPRERISHTCQQCHSGIYDVYKDSVHGEALLIDSDPDVPVCIDCHGVHDIHDPTTDLARVRSPQLCANCHADEDLMSQHDLSTDVFETYVADFHGTTVQLFDPEDPDAAINKAVCYDCHGVHNIRPVDDPDSGIKANLLETCQQCHPDATENFPDAWTSHYQPSLENNPLVYMVDLFYAFLIPVTLGGLGFLVIIDIYRRVRNRLKK